jgi:hypothetical protein
MIISLVDIKASLGVTAVGQQIDDIYTNLNLSAEAILSNYLNTSLSFKNNVDIFYIIKRFRDKEVSLDLGLSGFFDIKNIIVLSGEEKTSITENVDNFILDKSNGVITIHDVCHSKFYKVSYDSGFLQDVNGIFIGDTSVYKAVIIDLIKALKKAGCSDSKDCSDSNSSGIISRYIRRRDLYNTRKAL